MPTSDSSSSTFYFAYGSNMSLARMKSRDVLFSSRKPAVLKDFELVFNIKDDEMLNPEVDCLKGYANIQPNEGARVEGFVYGITEASIEKLESIEIGYKKTEVLVLGNNNENYKAITFIGEASAVKPGLLPPSWYMNYLLDAACDLSSGYQNYLSSFEVFTEVERLK